MKADRDSENNIFNKIIFYLICLLPISIIAGSLVININVILIILFFLIEIIKKNKYFVFNNYIVLLFTIYYVYLILSSILIAESDESLLRSIGVIRYLLLSLSIAYIIKNLDQKKILYFWGIIFLIVSFDILFEYIFGENILGYKSGYHGRIASFTGDELNIGGYYFGFFLLTSALLIKKNYLFPISILFFLFISIIIGERANFLKVFLLVTFFFLFIYKISLKKKIASIILFSVFTVGIIASDEKLSGRFYTQFQQNDLKFFTGIKTRTPHYSHYITSIKIFKDYPLFGIGIKNFRNISHKKEYHGTGTGSYGGGPHPHQTHLELLSETGLIGYFILISIFIYSLYFGIREYVKSKNIFLACSIIFILVTFIPLIPSGSFFTTYTATIFWINYGFLLGNSKIINLK